VSYVLLRVPLGYVVNRIELTRNHITPLSSDLLHAPAAKTMVTMQTVTMLLLTDVKIVRIPILYEYKVLLPIALVIIINGVRERARTLTVIKSTGTVL
jgi:hypothetical protein